MLATNLWPPAPPPAFSNYPQNHLPPRPSPLSPRSANARRFAPQTISEDMPKVPTAASPSRARRAQQADVPFSKRPARPNPLIHNRPRGADAREAHRRLFMQRVAKDRDDRRWAERGEHLLQLDFNRERKQWRREKERSAPEDVEWDESDAADGDALVLSGRSADFAPAPVVSKWSQSTPDSSASAMDVSQRDMDEDEDEREAELARWQEEREIEELLAMRDEEESKKKSSAYGSDEDDYDGIFMELAEKENQDRPSHGMVGEDAMDTSRD